MPKYLHYSLGCVGEGGGGGVEEWTKPMSLSRKSKTPLIENGPDQKVVQNSPQGTVKAYANGKDPVELMHLCCLTRVYVLRW